MGMVQKAFKDSRILAWFVLSVGGRRFRLIAQLVHKLPFVLPASSASFLFIRAFCIISIYFQVGIPTKGCSGFIPGGSAP
jgi:hypothetical protein